MQQKGAWGKGMGLDMKILVDKIEFRFYSEVNVILSIRFIFLFFFSYEF